MARPASASTLRPPQSTRESTSRPSWSCRAARRALGPVERDADRLARAVSARRTARTARCRARGRAGPSPTAPVPVRRNRSAVEHRGRHRVGPQLRHEQHDEQVGDDVDDDVERGDEDRDRLHLAHVADRDGVDELLAEPGVGEQVLDDDDAADQVLDVLREHLHATARARCAARSAQTTSRSRKPLSRAIWT